MKKVNLILLICILFSSNIKAQNEFHDAIKLSRFLAFTGNETKFIIPVINDPDSTSQLGKTKEYCDILNKYYQNKFKTSALLHRGLSSFPTATSPNPDYNPFLAPYLSPNQVLAV